MWRVSPKYNVCRPSETPSRLDNYMDNKAAGTSQLQSATDVPIESRKHRYPFSLVWTPIHPLSWVMPYVGHVGLADAAGRVIDFAGPYYVGFDHMSFGWPTRYYLLEEQQECGSDSWDPTIYEIASQYELVGYDFVRWNCHSLVASALNKIDHPRECRCPCFRGWTVVSVAWLFFFRSKHLGTSGLIYTWGGHFGLWAMVLAQAIHEGSLQVVGGWLALQLALFVTFGGWFSLLAVLRCDSQYGRCRAIPMSAEPLMASMDEHASGTGGPTEHLQGGTVREPASLYKSSPVLRPFRSAEAPPMRVDTFGDLVALGEQEEDATR